MTASHFYFCAVSKSVWGVNDPAGKGSLASLAVDALASERKILKEVNLESEYRYYSLICQQLERKVIDSKLFRLVNSDDSIADTLRSGLIATKVAPAGYLALLAHDVDEANQRFRLGASFYPPEKVQEHLQAFKTWVQQEKLESLEISRMRISFFEEAFENNCAVVEIQAPFLIIDEKEFRDNWDIYRTAHSEEHELNLAIPSDYEITGESLQFFTEKSKQQAAKLLSEQIHTALQNGDSITIGNQARHDVITEILHELVFSTRPEARPLLLRIAYVDGSEGDPFPIFCFEKTAKFELIEKSRLSAALMSIRHFELDEKIDFCWFRNREVSQSRTLAESEAFCYKTSLAQLRQFLNGQDIFSLDLYHTGFEPAVIGFYRALVQVMMEVKLKKISVLPLYFRGKAGFERGSSWEN